MNLKDKLLKLSKSLFFVLLLTIPVNLGKHFIIVDSYVGGMLVDYLIPTLWFQDILAFLTIFTWLLGSGLRKLSNERGSLFSRKEIQYCFLFIFSVLLSVISSVRFIPSLFSYLRLLLYFFIFIYILVEIPIEHYFFKILKVISFSILFLSILGVAQYINKGSVFKNYFILGEQPYSASTFNVAKKAFLGRIVVPSYGLFRHPNIFGGYLSVFLIWILSFIKSKKYFLIVFLLGCISLFFTFSLISWGVFIFGVLINYFFLVKPNTIRDKKRILLILVLIFAIFTMLIPFSDILKTSKDPRIYRRLNFIRASYRMVKDYPLFGVGWNNSTVLIDSYNFESRDIRFLQPVHNIFLLVFSESGVFSFILFMLFLYFSAKKLINSSYFHLFLISFLQIILLGSFDHYLLTINQTLLLFWVILGFALQ
jgi:hypothetical protein